MPPLHSWGADLGDVSAYVAQPIAVVEVVPFADGTVVPVRLNR